MVDSAPLNFAGSYCFSDCFPGSQALHVKNDVYMALIAEIQLGAGRVFQDFVLVSISTGIGVGVALRGRPLNIRTEMGIRNLGSTSLMTDLASIILGVGLAYALALHLQIQVGPSRRSRLRRQTPTPLRI